VVGWGFQAFMVSGSSQWFVQDLEDNWNEYSNHDVGVKQQID